MMVNFVGAGPGAVDLITVRGMELIKRADEYLGDYESYDTVKQKYGTN